MLGFVCRGVLFLFAVGAVNAQESDLNSTAWQPPEERAAQEQLPMSDSPLWKVLGQATIKYQNKPPYISAQLTPVIKKLGGKEVKVAGFVLPMDEGMTTLKTRHFMLSLRTPTCANCPPGEPDEVIEVMTQVPVTFSSKLVEVKGVLKLINNTENGVFYQIPAAVVVGEREVTPKP